ncbi:short-chain dehydrogenase [Streptomyces sp. CB00455]|uniref:oxidoreductase n=1 Tax=Streptomyces sp. CB00455 TaxID=1703927 RepID=UPI00093E5D83|nr:oxidoreductase [Streptomyces sp. CB00455]OKK14249.1 short-chain dehydrogenase [Streptomyces sp. CB00455]
MVWSTADVPDQCGRTALVTGASGGIGLETARVLAERGARVLLACRDAERGLAAAARIGGRTEVVRVDLASLDSVRGAARDIRRRVDRLDLLVNNAGVMFPEYGRTQDGFEPHFGVNHLGHFALTGLLLGLMRDVPGSRVVSVASLAHRAAVRGVGVAEVRGARGHRSVMAYGRSKLANLMFARELQCRLTAAGAETVSVAAHPGLSATGLWHDGAPGWLRPVSAAALRWLGQSAASAALPSLRAATDPLVPGGAYLGPGGPAECHGGAGPARSSRASRDVIAQIRLWEMSEELTGVRYARWAGRGADARPVMEVAR